MKRNLLTSIIFFAYFLIPANGSAQILLEAESFENKGARVVDQQFMDQMGSSFLMAHCYLSSSRAAIMKGATPFVSLSIRFSFT